MTKPRRRRQPGAAVGGLCIALAVVVALLALPVRNRRGAGTRTVGGVTVSRQRHQLLPRKVPS
ncbi:MAG: hypothetical protein Q4G35_01340 [Propionibacteriaceae bacterium]|nr:hypothetical protein [Propionibacteriaceae bacterium]